MVQTRSSAAGLQKASTQSPTSRLSPAPTSSGEAPTKSTTKSRRWAPYPAKKPKSKPKPKTKRGMTRQQRRSLIELRTIRLLNANMRFMKAYSVFPTVSDSNKGNSRSVQFSISWPDNGRVGQCGKLHVVDQLCRSCNRGWNGWSFKQLQASRIGYDSDTGELQATPAQLEHVGGDDVEKAATGVGYCRLSENEVPKCFEMRCKVCQVSDGLLEGPPVDMRLIQKA